jgi:outer membrane protein assembly factor BamB/enterochelin esterase-like enzyme
VCLADPFDECHDHSLAKRFRFKTSRGVSIPSLFSSTHSIQKMNHFISKALLGTLVLVAILFGAANDTKAQDWGSIRGPHFDGSASLDDSEIGSGDLQLSVAWKRPFGSGYSGIVKSGDHLVSAMADKEVGEEFIVAMSADSGKTVWKTSTGKIMKGENGSFDGPLSTPAVDDAHAYHLSPFGNLAAYSLHDGSVVWSHNLKEEFAAEPNFYGFGASPILHSGVLILAVGAESGAVMGFDPSNGNVVWKAGQDGAAFQTPVPAVIDGKEFVIAATNTKVFAIDPHNGDVAWTQPHAGASEMAMSVMPMVVPGGGVFLNDSKDHSTVLDLGTDAAVERWTGRDIRNSYCAAVMSGGQLCSYSSRFLVAVDPQTGKRQWRARSPGDGFLATVAGRLVVATLKGTLHIGDVTSDGFTEVAATEVFKTGVDESDGLLWSLPSVAGRSVYLRSLGAIARVDIQTGNRQIDVAAQESQVGPGFAAFLKQLESASDKQAVVDDFLSGKPGPLIEGDVVHFVFQGQHQDVAVASELFGVRQERSMQRVDGTNLFYFGTKVPKATRVSYVYFADYQPKIDPTHDRQVASTALTGEMEPMFMAAAEPLTLSWFDTGGFAAELPASIDNASAKMAGEIVKAQLDSAMMKTKLGLSIYLPPGYAESQQKYPVVFVHEGKEAIEQGNQASIVDALITNKEIRPTVVVFIDWRFYPMQGANGYPQMFAMELLPKILKEYRISDDRKDRACMSGGFGATLSLMASLPASGEVGRIGCHSPFAFELMHPIIGQLAKLPNDRCDVLVQWGAYEFRNPSENWNMAIQGKAIADILREGGHKVETETTATGSDWVCWRTQSVRMWKFLLGE